MAARTGRWSMKNSTLLSTYEFIMKSRLMSRWSGKKKTKKKTAKPVLDKMKGLVVRKANEVAR